MNAPFFISARRRRLGKAARLPPAAPEPPPVPVAPTLVAATFSDLPATVDLTFDRPVDVSAIVPAQILVDDGQFTATRYAGTGTPTIINPSRIVLNLAPYLDYFEFNLILNASGTTGIVAVDGGLPWAGVSNVNLPFP